MNENNIQAYGELSCLFYDAIDTYASEKEVNFFISFLEQYPGRTLEAMSGSGRLQIPLMQRGYVIDGVDNSCAMLASCRKRCEKLDLRPNIYEQSLEDLALPYKYRNIMIAIGSFQLITDHDITLKVLRNLNACLLPGGNLLIDIFEPDITVDDFSIVTVRLDEHRIIRLTKRHAFNVEKKLVNSFCLYELIVDGIVQQQENELMEVVWRSDSEWQELLFKAGFEVIRIYDELFKKSNPSRVIHARAVTKN